MRLQTKKVVERLETELESFRVHFELERLDEKQPNVIDQRQSL